MMARVYGRAQGGISPHERERAVEVHAPAHPTREAEAARTDVRIETDPNHWINPTSLNAPDPRPGMVQRWIFDGDLLEPDARARAQQNFLNKVRQGWSPRDPASISHNMRALYQTSKGVSGQEVIRVGNSVLCEMPEQIARQRFDALNDVTRRQGESVAPSLDEARARMRGISGVGDVEVASNKAETYTGRPAPTLVD